MFSNLFFLLTICSYHFYNTWFVSNRAALWGWRRGSEASDHRGHCGRLPVCCMRYGCTVDSELLLYLPCFCLLSPGVFSFLHNISVVIVPQPSSHMVARCTCICVCCAVCTSNPFGTIVALISYHLTIIKKKTLLGSKTKSVDTSKELLVFYTTST